LKGLGPDVRVSMNCWRFDSAIFPACRVVPPSPRAELELPLAVQHAVDTGAFRVRVLPADETVLDLSSRLDVAAVTARLQGITPRP
jgi:dTDP-glucose pyrophosphorylase